MCSRMVTASALGVTLATLPENSPPPRPPPPPARPPPVPLSGIGPGPCCGPAAPARAPIGADVVRAEAGRQAGREQELGVEARDLEKHRTGALVPVERKIAVELLHAGGARVDRRYRAGSAALLTATATSCLP